ncbi:hypothetical protein LCGC14_0934360 [marine sediment metagenome]|uniref:Uncharacterized protein n=1 Tax=marine sediment metagenome TaxID=412755 RepID=A0A0F9R5G9_9ZZZZ
MSNEYNFPVSEGTYKKITEISNSLNIEKETLINLAFHELFDLIINDSQIFLEKIGTIEKLRNIINKE